MDHNQFIDKLYKKREDIIRICAYYGIVGYQADDIEQDLYLKIYNYKNIDKYILNNEPNMYIIFAIIRNLIFDYRKRESKFADEIIVETKDIEYEENSDYVINKYNYVISEIDKIEDHFKRTLIKLYFLNEHTIRSLSKETKIGISTIQPIIRDFKLRIKNQKNII